MFSDLVGKYRTCVEPHTKAHFLRGRAAWRTQLGERVKVWLGKLTVKFLGTCPGKGRGHGGGCFQRGSPGTKTTAVLASWGPPGHGQPQSNAAHRRSL